MLKTQSNDVSGNRITKARMQVFHLDISFFNTGIVQFKNETSPDVRLVFSPKMKILELDKNL